MASVWIVSLEWNQPPSEVTRETGIEGVYTEKADAERCGQASREDLDNDGHVVYQYSMAEGRYCQQCGEINEQGPDQGHVCDNKDEDEAFCDQCGAGLMSTGSCDNDHDEWDVDVHVTEHQVQEPGAKDRCSACGSEKPIGQSCVCFDNQGQ